MHKIILLIVILSAAALAQIDQEILDKQGDVCGNNKRERFELCDDPKGREHGLCPEAGKLLRIVMVCHPKTCGCIPYKNKDCGNGIREGSEFCDPPAEDQCQMLGGLIGVPLECNPKSCMCRPPKDVAVGPGVVEKEESPCGNNKLDAGEKCDPPGRTCTYEDKGVAVQGICTDSCACEKIPEPEVEPVAEPEEETVEPAKPEETQQAEQTTPAQQEQKTEATEQQETESRSTLRIILGIIILVSTGFLVYMFVKKQRKTESSTIDEMEETEKNEKE